jgi:hypothetical protein
MRSGGRGWGWQPVSTGRSNKKSEKKLSLNIKTLSTSSRSSQHWDASCRQQLPFDYFAEPSTPHCSVKRCFWAELHERYASRKMLQVLLTRMLGAFVVLVGSSPKILSNLLSRESLRKSLFTNRYLFWLGVKNKPSLWRRKKALTNFPECLALKNSF